MTGYDDAAFDAIQRVFDDRARAALADRLDELLTVLDEQPGAAVLRRNSMHQPKVWAVFVSGSGEDRALLWEPDARGEPYIHSPERAGSELAIKSWLSGCQPLHNQFSGFRGGGSHPFDECS